MLESGWAAVAAFCATAVSAPVVLHLLRGRIMDVPTARSNHEVPTPRGGGLALIIGLAIGYPLLIARSAELTVALTAAVALGAIGLAEDVRGLGIKTRFTAQLVVGATAAALIVATTNMAWWQVAAAAGIGAIWLSGYTNAFNFMDGINGISAFQLVVAGLTWVVAGRLDNGIGLVGAGAITIASAAGFLPWNFPKARFFMGDVGSYFSGAWIAGVTVVALTAGVSPWPLFAAVSVYLADTAFTLATRMIRGEDWLESHSSHVFQRLVAAGWSHSRTDAFYIGISACLVAIGFLATGQTLAVQLLCGVALVVLLSAYLGSPAKVAKGSRLPTP